MNIQAIIDKRSNTVTLRCGDISVSAPVVIVSGGDMPCLVTTGQADPRFSSLPRELAHAMYPDDYERDDHDRLLLGCPGPRMRAAWDQASRALEQSYDEARRRPIQPVTP